MEKITKIVARLAKQKSSVSKIKFELRNLKKEEQKTKITKNMISIVNSDKLPEYYNQPDITEKVERQLEEIKFKIYILQDILENELTKADNLEDKLYNECRELDNNYEGKELMNKVNKINKEVESKGLFMQFELLDTL